MNTSHDNQEGDKVNTTEHSANPAVTSSTGLFAALGGLLRVKGSGMPKITQGSGLGGRALDLLGALPLPFPRCSRLPAMALSVLAATLGTLALTAAPASAKLVHAYSKSFGGPGEGAGEMDLASAFDFRTARGSGGGVAVNEVTHDVYIADAGNHRVDEFEPDGTFVRAWGWGVNKKSPKAELQECTAATECQAGTSESAPGAFEEPVFVAIDNDPLSASHGDVYVGDPGDDLVTKFTAEGQLEALWGTGGQLNGSAAEEGPFLRLYGIAVDSSGALSVLAEAKHVKGGSSQDWFKFAADGVAELTVPIENSAEPVGIGLGSSGDLYKVRNQQEGYLEEFSASGQELYGYEGFQGVTAFAIEPITNDIYLAQKNEVTRIPSKSQSQIERFGAGHLTEGASVAVDASTGNAASGDVYVADSTGDDVAVFALGLLPEVTVQPVSSFPSTTSATLTGTVNPQGLAVNECKFEYISATALHPASVNEVQTVTLSEEIQEGFEEFQLEFKGEKSSYSPLNSAEGVQEKLEEMTTIGPKNVAVTSVNEIDGPYRIEFKGALGDQPLPLITSPTPGVSVALTTEGVNAGLVGGWGAAASVPCVPGPGDAAGEIGTGSAPVPVSATATGLTQGETYYYRLSATNAVGTDNESEGTFLQPKTVVVEGESASSVETGAATLQATIDPGGSETRYHFEYGPAAGDYDVSVPIPDREIPAEPQGVEVSARATGLQPSTTYHYRVVAENSLPGAVAGPDQTFTTLTPQGTGSPANCKNEQRRAEQPYGLELPDCRAYERVSPVETEGADIKPFMARAAVSGEAIVYASENSFAEPAGAQFINSYLSRRGPDGWSTQDITPPSTLGRETNIVPPFQNMVFSPELTEGAFVQYGGPPLSSEAPALHEDLFVADFADRSYELVPTVSPEFEPQNHYSFRPGVQGTSTDLSHVVFDLLGVLTPGASPNQRHAYEWVNGPEYQVDVPPTGTTFTGGVDGGSSHSVSEDGLRVDFSEEAQGAGRQLYVRENPEQPPTDGSECAVPGDACTIEVSASQKKNGSGPDGSDPYGPQPATPQGASANGSRIFFTSNAELTEDANTGEKDNAANLYECELVQEEAGHSIPPKCDLTDLSIDTEAGDKEKGAQVNSVEDISEDGSYVYFIAEGVLAKNENTYHATAEAGQPNLYVYHEGKTTFIAKPAGGYGSRVSADGTHLAFSSERSLTDYDNQPLTPNGIDRTCAGPDGCSEVYLYDASAGSLVCASCDPSGERPVGAAWFGDEHGPGYGEAENTYVSHNLSADGSRLFFNSWDPLVPHVSNGLDNVYEYEQGHVYPISNVAGPYESVLLDASENGNDVFFETADGLLPGGNEHADVYDARVEGGFPVAASIASCDNGDSCRGPESPQPAVFGAPGSATFSGVGNLTSEVAPPPKRVVTKKTVKCRKGYVKKKERCVKVKSKKAKKSTHGKGSK
jgi:WD40-like Beta Propeller Repeat